MLFHQPDAEIKLLAQYTLPPGYPHITLTPVISIYIRNYTAKKGSCEMGEFE